jgi:hypothetical protein
MMPDASALCGARFKEFSQAKTSDERWRVADVSPALLEVIP